MVTLYLTIFRNLIEYTHKELNMELFKTILLIAVMLAAAIVSHVTQSDTVKHICLYVMIAIIFYAFCIPQTIIWGIKRLFKK